MGGGCVRGAGDVRDGENRPGFVLAWRHRRKGRIVCSGKRVCTRGGRCARRMKQTGVCCLRRRYRRKGRIDCGGKRVCARGGRRARCGETDRGLLLARRRLGGDIGEKGVLIAMGSECARGAGDVREGGEQTGVCCLRGGGIGEKGVLIAVRGGRARGAGDVRDGAKQTAVCSGAAAEKTGDERVCL